MFSKYLITVKVHARSKPNFDLLEMWYSRVPDDPQGSAQKIYDYLGAGLDVEAVVVDPALYRNRQTGEVAEYMDQGVCPGCCFNAI